MSSEQLVPPSITDPDAEFTIPWTLEPTGGLWSLTDPAPALPPYFFYVSRYGRVTEVSSRPLVEEEHPPITASVLQVNFPTAPHLNLGEYTELRFWLRSSLPANGSDRLPFYLVFEASNSAHTWRRFLPVQQPQQWELHQLWLGDMRPELRQQVTTFRLYSLNPRIALATGFTLAIGDLLAVLPQPVRDVREALRSRLTGFRLPITPADASVDVVVEHPEEPGARASPYILMIPWSVQTKGELGGSIEPIDNYGEHYAEDDVTHEHPIPGACIRPPLSQLQLDYAIDVYTDEAHEKAQLFDDILQAFSQRPFLLVNGQRLPLLPFEPPPERMAEFAAEGHRTPLFYQVTLPIETGDRRFVPFALHPRLLPGQRTRQPTATGDRLEPDRTTTEVVPV